MKSQFKAMAFNDIEKSDNTYVNARYAPSGNETVGIPFPLFRQGGGYFTDWTSAGQSASNFKRRLNLPSDNTTARSAQQMNAIGLANDQNTAFVFRSQTLLNNGDPIACRNNTDCDAWPGTTCNSQHMSWNDAKGNQGNYCAVTKYPEIDSGEYIRKGVNQGGIGRSCYTDSDCGQDYSCNNETDIFGKNIQQTGYCAQTYECGDGKKRYLGYPYNSSVPIAPSASQNNNGRGYQTKDECNTNSNAQQDCKQGPKGKWFATYPGYCPVVPNLRNDSNPVGSFVSSSIRSRNNGIILPSYGPNEASSIGSSSAVGAFSNWNNYSSVSEGMGGPREYEMSINPVRKN